MTIKRRKLLQRAAIASATGMAVGAGLINPREVFAARPDAAFAANSSGDALKALFNSEELQASSDVSVKAPDIAENGAVVPVEVRFNLPGATRVSVVVENNPNPLAADFSLTAKSGGMVSTRIKMGKTSTVAAVVEANGKLYSASKEVKVTIGGCGG